MSTKTTQAEAVGMEMMRMLWPPAMAAQAIHAAARLELADRLAQGPKTVAELAEATHAHADALGRLLRALASLGIFAADGPGRFRQTEMSATLCKDAPSRLSTWAMMLGAHFVWRPTGELTEAVMSGQAPFRRLYGASFFEHMDEHADDAAYFHAAMSSSPEWTAALMGAYEFSRFGRLVDVGGGQGRTLAAIVDAHPRLQGVVFDLPGVVAGAVRHERCERVGGDFFREVPGGADGYLLKGVIHDWDDEAAEKILSNVRRAMRPDATVLIADTVLTAESEPPAAMMDLLMMVLGTGRERTEEEFRTLLPRAGLKLERVIRRERVTLVEGRAG
ncbi:MAG: methyltransferase [Terriglobales bacterium]